MTARLLVLSVSLAIAPVQCGHDYDPSLRKDESPGDALWQLAQKFHEDHDEAAAQRTLQYLVTQYPASRWAPAARDALDAGPGGRADGG